MTLRGPRVASRPLLVVGIVVTIRVSDGDSANDRLDIVDVDGTTVGLTNGSGITASIGAANSPLKGST